MRLTIKILSIFSLILTIFHFHDAILFEKTKAENEFQEKESEIFSPEIPESPLILNMTLLRKYIDGEISEEFVEETVWALEDFWSKYESWQLVDMDESNLILQLEVDDISPLLKVNGFFGISDDGTLSIFNGKPNEQDVIQSFFQIDVEKLEGNKRSQLIEGIPVKNKEDYTEVLKMMKRYSIKNKS